MKKLIQINTVCDTSTGKIMGEIQREAINQGFDTLSFVGRRQVFQDLPCEKFGDPISFWIHVIITTIFDRQGYGSYFNTRKLIRQLRREKPDIIHLHNLHGYYLNLPLFFCYLKNEFQGKLFWTFHDCWPFTGHCPYFTIKDCQKWKEECHHCPNRKNYPVSFFMDSSKSNFHDKKRMFENIPSLIIITPSQWLKDLVKQSFLRDYPVKVIPNGIDVQTFAFSKKTEIENKFHIPENKKIILGVAGIWERRKGMEDFLQLADFLSEEYCIVLVGVSKPQKAKLPENIIGIIKTENKEELAAIYSRADIFLNPSREETFSLVTAEAFACGTPVIVLDTSAVKELVTPDNGIVLKCHEVQDYLRAIKEIERMGLSRKQVAQTAKKYDNHLAAARVIEEYREVL